jgi:hypothetical protein
MRESELDEEDEQRRKSMVAASEYLIDVTRPLQN